MQNEKWGNGEREIRHTGHVRSVEIFHRNRYLPARRAQAGRDRYRKWGKGKTTNLR